MATTTTAPKLPALTTRFTPPPSCSTKWWSNLRKDNEIWLNQYRETDHSTCLPPGYINGFISSKLIVQNVFNPGTGGCPSGYSPAVVSLEGTGCTDYYNYNNTIKTIDNPWLQKGKVHCCPEGFSYSDACARTATQTYCEQRGKYEPKGLTMLGADLEPTVLTSGVAFATLLVLVNDGSYAANPTPITSGTDIPKETGGGGDGGKNGGNGRGGGGSGGGGMTKIIIYTCVACVFLIALLLGYALLRRHRKKKALLGGGRGGDDVVEPKIHGADTPLKSQPADMGNISEAGGSEIHLQELAVSGAGYQQEDKAAYIGGTGGGGNGGGSGPVYHELHHQQQQHTAASELNSKSVYEMQSNTQVYELPPSPAPSTQQRLNPNSYDLQSQQAVSPVSPVSPVRDSIGVKAVNTTPVPDFLQTTR